jgi:hypothetical protein
MGKKIFSATFIKNVLERGSSRLNWTQLRYLNYCTFLKICSLWYTLEINRHVLLAFLIWMWWKRQTNVNAGLSSSNSSTFLYSHLVLLRYFGNWNAPLQLELLLSSDRPAKKGRIKVFLRLAPSHLVLFR